MFKNFKIKPQTTLSIIIALLLSLAITYVGYLIINKTNFEKILEDNANHIEADFNNLQTFDMKMLSSTLEALVQDPAIKNLYLEGDREKLYNYTEPLFSRLKANYDITHWYFILPDGRDFIRVHNQELYDDEITRFTFYGARDTGRNTAGIELGKTAYALRSVMPYYDGDDLIGYMELGEEIEHFLNILEAKTENQVLVVVNKDYLDEEKWISVRRVAGLRNNWNDYEDYVFMGDEEEEQDILKCFTEENLIKAEDGIKIFQRITKDSEPFQCAGIPLIDASGERTGILFYLMDINPYLSLSQDSIILCVIFLASFLIFYGLSNLLLSGKSKNKLNA